MTKQPGSLGSCGDKAHNEPTRDSLNKIIC